MICFESDVPFVDRPGNGFVARLLRVPAVGMSQALMIVARERGQHEIFTAHTRRTGRPLVSGPDSDGVIDRFRQWLVQAGRIAHAGAG